MKCCIFDAVRDIFVNVTGLDVPVVGVVGDWKNHFSAEQLAKFTSVIRKELENESFSLPWSLD